MAKEGLPASRMSQAKRVVGAVLSQAVEDLFIGRNSAGNVKVPKTRPREKRYLTAEQVTELAGAVGERMEGGDLLVKVLAYAGFRWGEAVTLRGGQVDVLRRHVRARESATLVKSELVWGPPKTHRDRTVVTPSFLAEELAELIDGDELIFTSPDGHPLRTPNFLRRVWRPAVADCDLGDLVPHDLRHAAASLAISAGASVKAIQRTRTCRPDHPWAGTRTSITMTSRTSRIRWMLVTVRLRCGPNPNRVRFPTSRKGTKRAT